MFAGNYSCVPSYSTPDWVLVRVIPQAPDDDEFHHSDDDLHHPKARVVIEKQPASLLELGVKKQQDEVVGEVTDLRWM